jgi:hypothetical protein
MILLLSASAVARVTGMSHQCPSVFVLNSQVKDMLILYWIVIVN